MNHENRTFTKLLTQQNLHVRSRFQHLHVLHVCGRVREKRLCVRLVNQDIRISLRLIVIQSHLIALSCSLEIMVPLQVRNKR